MVWEDEVSDEETGELMRDNITGVKLGVGGTEEILSDEAAVGRPTGKEWDSEWDTELIEGLDEELDEEIETSRLGVR